MSNHLYFRESIKTFGPFDLNSPTKEDALLINHLDLVQWDIFLFWLSLALLWTRHKILLWYILSLTGQLFDPNFLCSSEAIDGSILSNCEPFLTWPFPVRLSFLTFWVRHSWNSNFEIEGTQTWFILQILQWCYGRKFHVLDFMKNYSNLNIFSKYQKKKWKCKMFYFQLIF